MRGTKTATLLVLLNLFNLNRAHADEFYDVLKARGKYDAQSTKEARKNTVEKKRVDTVNALTRENPNFIPLSQTSPLIRPSDQELKRMQEADANEPAAEPEDKNKKPIEISGGQKDVRTGTSENTAPSQSSRTSAPSAAAAPPPASAPLKVINTDPDEVTFPGEEKSSKKLKP